MNEFSSLPNTIEYEVLRKLFENSYDEKYVFLGFESDETAVTDGDKITSPNVSIGGLGRENIEMTPCINDISTPNMSMALSLGNISTCMFDSPDLDLTPCIMNDINTPNISIESENATTELHSASLGAKWDPIYRVAQTKTSPK